ncbi:hypothetical protein P9112_013186 [Eukaryota sp. TZLM1-RC]
MFSGLIKLVYWEYLNYLEKLFENYQQVKAKFYTKCGISKVVAQFAQELVNDHSILNMLFLEDPQELNIGANDHGPNVINTVIKRLDVFYDDFDHEEADYDQPLLSFFPVVEFVKIGGESLCGERFAINLTHSSNLKCLELDFESDVEELPTSLVKLVLKHYAIEVNDLSYLPLLKELVVSCYCISEGISTGEIHVPQSIRRL